MRKLLLTVVAVGSFVAGGVAQAQPKGASHTHDGLFLQMDLGLGGMTSTLKGPGGELELSGLAGEFSIALGYAVTQNFVLAAHYWGASVSEPDVKLNGQDLGTASDATQTLAGLGLNLTYYFMPINIYVSATPSIGFLSVEEGGSELDTDSGFAMRLAVGKEWWVSDNWGIGLNVQYAFGSNDLTDTTSSFDSSWFGAAFSATYN